MKRAAARADWQGGWWSRATAVASSNRGPRPPQMPVELVVIHSISLPPGHYRGDAIERLFCNRLDWDADPYFQRIRGLKVSSHFLIRRAGKLLQFVSCDERAWHAGASSWQRRENCNDYSVGVELEGLEGEPFTVAQYRRLVTLLRALERRYPLRWVVGHEHVAPGRKRDPGAAFDWQQLVSALGWPRERVPPALG